MALSYCSPVRLLLWIILAFLVLFAFAAPNTEWIAWLLGVILLAIFLMLDAMFSNPADFVFDPSVSEALRWNFGWVCTHVRSFLFFSRTGDFFLVGATLLRTLF